MIPRRFIAYALTQVPAIFTAYGRPLSHIFYAALVGSQSSQFQGLFSFEIVILGSILLLSSGCLLYLTWTSKHAIHNFKTANITDKELKDAFNRNDSSKNGELSMDELSVMLKDLGFPMSKNGTNLL
jgi:hypothetical protein